MKRKKLSKALVSFVLSAALLAEPFAGMPAVYALEAQITGQENIEEKAEGAEKPSEESATDTANPESGEGYEKTENPEPGTGNGQNDSAENETGNGQDDSSESGSGNQGTDDATAPDAGSEDGTTVEPGTENGDNADDAVSGQPGIEDGSEESGEDTETETDGATEETEDMENPEDQEDSEEKTSETEENSEEPEDMSGGFSDMPDGYRLTSFQRALKADLSEDLGQLRESDEGGAYAAKRVYTFAESREEAEQIAAAYHAEIEAFSMGVLTLRLSEDKTVRSAVMAASDLRNNLPAVWPDYRRELYGEFKEVSSENMQVQEETGALEVIEEEYSLDDDLSGQEADDVSAQEAYEQALSGWDSLQEPYLQPTDEHYQWFHTAIGSPYAWAAGYTGQSVTVGVIDSGVSPNPDLDDNIVGGYNFCDDTTDTGDMLQHGTHVAGVIAALANGEQGAGVAPQAKIYNAKVFGEDEERSGYDSTIMRAILYLIHEEDNSTNDAETDLAARVDIINMSLGGSGDTAGFQAVLDKAREKGVIVFAATGNDGAATMMYPASYDHVIAVAATDINNQRAYFSNYGYKTDLAAPGVNIWGTYTDGKGNASYMSLQGTSMACPVAAGEAAVILSGQADLPKLQNKTGADRVDALEAVMKGNVVSAGEGMGKGITNLAKVFHLSTAAMKPNAPEIHISDNSGDTGQSVEVTITAQVGTRLCYTTNGKNPVYQKEEANAYTTLADSHTVTFTIDGSAAAQGTVKAFAIDESGVISAVKSKKYKLTPYVRQIVVSGPAKVERGKSIQLTAAVSPAYAANKKVVWDLKNAAGEAVDITRVKVDSEGKVTVSEDAELGTYIITAQAGDNGGAEDTYTISVIAAGTAVSSLVFDKTIEKELWMTEEEPYPTLPLSMGLTAVEKDEAGNSLELTGDRLAGHILWTSSKPAVADVDGNGLVTAKAVGTATITATANDNSKKKASIKITVRQGVTAITITTAAGKTEEARFTVAAGKSIALKASVMPAKSANKKVKWSVSSELQGVYIHPVSGKLSVAAGTQSGICTVTATAADGRGAAATRQIRVYGSMIGGINLDTSKVTLYTQKVDEEKTNTKTIMATITGAGGRTDFDPNAYLVSSSNEAIVQAEIVADSETQVNAEGKRQVQIKLTATGARYGQARVVIASTDGSNRKKTCTVTVSGGIQKVALQDSAGKKVSSLQLFRDVGNGAPSVATLQAVIQGSDGANMKAYEVVSSNPALVKASIDTSTNQISLRASQKSTGKATVTLKATDGSGKKAVCAVTVSNPASRINIAPKAGATKYVVSGKSIQLTATFETEYGKVANKRVAWEVSNTATGMGITVNGSGKISVPTGLENRVQDFTVTATAMDGSGLSASYTVWLTKPTSYFRILPPEDGTVQGPYTEYKLYVINFTSDCTSQVACTSSSVKTAAPSVVYVPYNPTTKKGGTGSIMFMATRAGKATFTLKALDSSNKTYNIACSFRKKEKENP